MPSKKIKVTPVAIILWILLYMCCYRIKIKALCEEFSICMLTFCHTLFYIYSTYTTFIIDVVLSYCNIDLTRVICAINSEMSGFKGFLKK